MHLERNNSARVGLGTWNRTKIFCFKGRRPTVRRSPNKSKLTISNVGLFLLPIH